jgi:hypothetical protein
MLRAFGNCTKSAFTGIGLGATVYSIACLVLVLVIELPMAPMLPLRKCLRSVVLSTSPSHLHFHTPLCGRFKSDFVGFVAMLEAAVFTFFTWLVTWFQLSMTRLEKKFLFTTSLACLCKLKVQTLFRL